MKMLRNKTKSGFTLIEVLVSLSLFTVVVTICVSTLYALIDANARSRNAQSIATNLSFTIDSMTREIRTGRDFYCSASDGNLPTGANDDSTNDCLNGGQALSINEGGRSLTGNTPDNSRRIGYRLNGGKLQRRLGGMSWQDITSDDVDIATLRFYVEGTAPSDTVPPLVTLFVSGVVGDEDDDTRDQFSIQTTIPQRLLDL